jgi:hypothetical protein
LQRNTVVHVYGSLECMVSLEMACHGPGRLLLILLVTGIRIRTVQYVN